MAHLSFHERFKDRSTIISTQGDISINPSNFINKAKSDQLHTNILKTTGNSVVSSAHGSPVMNLNKSDTLNDNSSYKAQSEIIGPSNGKVKRGYNLSTIPKKKSVEVKTNKSFSISEYRPYSLKDYQNIKPKKYYQLGGLGPSDVGTEAWAKKKELKEKKWKYGVDVYYQNVLKLPMFPIGSPVRPEKKNSRSLALEFAKKIVKPPLKQPISIDN